MSANIRKRQPINCPITNPELLTFLMLQGFEHLDNHVHIKDGLWVYQKSAGTITIEFITPTGSVTPNTFTLLNLETIFNQITQYIGEQQCNNSQV